LSVKGLSRSDKVRDVSFEVRAGEIFGDFRTDRRRPHRVVASDLRSGHRRQRLHRGRLARCRRVQRHARRSTPSRHGIALITEDRKGEGLLLTQSISANIALGNMQAISNGWRGQRQRTKSSLAQTSGGCHAHPQFQPDAVGVGIVRRQPAESGHRPLAGARLFK
jgi:ABC-type sugar transport system ATPase subunit